VLPAGPTTATIEVEEDIDGGPLGVLSAGLAAATTEVEKDIDGGPPRGGIGGSGNCHRQS
jgi:hypothetical protein